MSVLLKAPPTDRIIISNVSWETYESLLKDLENQSSPRLAYDQGVLEIMSPHFEHDAAKEVLAYIAIIALEEQDIDFVAAGSTTFKRGVLKRGFEPDASFYIRNAARVRGKKRLNMEIDPPPELIIEIDVTGDSMDKFPLYAALQVNEVWRYAGAVEVWVLQQNRYVRQNTSKAIPILGDRLITELMESSLTLQRPAWARNTRQRIHSLMK
ncbi:MAG TPA: Uma2 family endonuclease [Terriglobia bacterium]|jgi:Uma2 family endonuclease